MSWPKGKALCRVLLELEDHSVHLYAEQTDQRDSSKSTLTRGLPFFALLPAAPETAALLSSFLRHLAGLHEVPTGPPANKHHCGFKIPQELPVKDQKCKQNLASCVMMIATTFHIAAAPRMSH